MLDFVARKQIRLGHLMHFGSLVLSVLILLKCGMYLLIPIQIKYTLHLTQISRTILKVGIHAPDRYDQSTLKRSNGQWIPE